MRIFEIDGRFRPHRHTKSDAAEESLRAEAKLKKPRLKTHKQFRGKSKLQILLDSPAERK